MRPVFSHHEMISLVGGCGCECHSPGAIACWCGVSARLPAGPPTFRLSHNDAVRFLGRCPSAHHSGTGAVSCDVRTDPRLRSGLERREGDEQLARIRRGQIRNGADLTRAIRMGVVPRGR